jgi:hypothetical protein
MTETRTCAVCGRGLTRREGEQASLFRRRKTCGGSCRNRLSARTTAADRPERLPENSKPCVVCGVVLMQRPDESVFNFRKRKTCDLACANISTGRGTSKPRVAEDRRCEICKDPIPYNGEELWRWRQRQRCDDPQCAHNHKGNPSPVINEKPCLHCGKTMSRDDQGLARFKAKKFCDYKCSADHRRASLPTEKVCVTCGKTTTRRPGEGAKDWRARQTCSTKCKYGYIGRRLVEVKPALEPPPKTCEVCGKLFGKKRTESHPTFEAKKTCGKRCANKAISGYRVELEPKPCVMCGELFGRRKGEPAGNFRSRLCCSMECFGDAISAARLGNRERQNPYPREWCAALTERIRERDGYICVECGAVQGKRKHHVHHIDYDKNNLAPRNLITLCPSCHGRTTSKYHKQYFIEHYRRMMVEREGKKAA